MLKMNVRSGVCVCVCVCMCVCVVVVVVVVCLFGLLVCFANKHY